jgi:apolipoprotein N-acyltransferase
MVNIAGSALVVLTPSPRAFAMAGDSAVKSSIQIDKLIAAGCGVVLGICTAYPQLWFVSLIAVVLLLAMVARASTAHSAYLTYFYAIFAMFVVGVCWIFNGIHSDGSKNVVVSMVLAAAFFAFFAAIHTALFILLDKLACKLKLQNVHSLVWFSFPLSFVLAELLRSVGPSAFPWLMLSHTQIDNPLLAGWFGVIGALGVTWLTVLLGSCLYLLAKGVTSLNNQTVDQRAPQLLSLKRTGILMLAIGIFSLGLLSINWATSAGQPQPLTLLYSNIPQETKWDDASRQTTWKELQQAIEATSAGIIITPETFFVDPAQVGAATTWVSLVNRIKQQGIEVLLGIPYSEFDQVGKPLKHYNAMMQLASARGDWYAKQHIVPFGEYLPFKQQLGWLYTDYFNYPLQGLSNGSNELGDSLFINGLFVAPAICYDIMFPQHILARAQQSSWVVHMSNDAWFKHELYEGQVTSAARARALESARPVVRVNNVGFTGLIGPDGRVKLEAEKSATAEYGLLKVSLQPVVGITPYVWLGYYPGAALILLLAIFAACFLYEI